MTEGLGGKRKVRANEEKGRVTVINQKLKMFFKKVQKKVKNVKKKRNLKNSCRNADQTRRIVDSMQGRKVHKEVSEGVVE